MRSARYMADLFGDHGALVIVAVYILVLYWVVANFAFMVRNPNLNSAQGVLHPINVITWTNPEAD